jgi:hypothetical protein
MLFHGHAHKLAIDFSSQVPAWDGMRPKPNIAIYPEKVVMKLHQKDNQQRKYNALALGTNLQGFTKDFILPYGLKQKDQAVANGREIDEPSKYRSSV